MLGLLRRRPADLGTAKKLAIGFTLVLLLTALVAALAVLSLHALGQRFARLQEMSAINRDVLEVRQAEKDFALHGKRATPSACASAWPRPLNGWAGSRPTATPIRRLAWPRWSRCWRHT